MIFWIMFVGVAAGFSIDAKYPPSTNVVLGLLATFCFSISIYVKFFLEKRSDS